MKSYARHIIAALAAVALAASAYALYVHYQLLVDPAYRAACDISETVSCQQVFESQYGSVAGVPVAAGGAIWAALVLGLAIWGMGQRSADAAGRSAGYVFLLATVGLAAVFYFAYTSFFVLRMACPVCLTIYVSVIGIFLVSASAAGSLASIPSRLGTDLSKLRRNPTGATLAAAWLVASIALVVFFPREQALNAEGTYEPPQTQMATVDPAIVTQLRQWFDAQPRVPETEPSGGTKVLFVKYNDFQCPACRQMYAEYRGVVAKWEESHPDAFKFENRDFPLEAECGVAAAHPSACEAAVAMRLARPKGKEREFEQWLFANQSQFSRDHIKQGLQTVAQVSGDEYDAQYATLIAEIRAESQVGQRIGVQSTPSFFLNGVRIPSPPRPEYMDVLIAYALEKANAAS